MRYPFATLVTLLLALTAADESRGQSDMPRPEFFGVYVMIDSKLVEIPELPSYGAGGLPVGGMDMIGGAPRLTVPAAANRILVYRRELSHSAPDSVFINFAARVAEERQYNFSGAQTARSVLQERYFVRNRGIRFRVAPVPGQPELVLLVPSDGSVLPAGAYSFMVVGKRYYFQVAGETTDPNHCVVRQLGLLESPRYVTCESLGVAALPATTVNEECEVRPTRECVLDMAMAIARRIPESWARVDTLIEMALVSANHKMGVRATEAIDAALSAVLGTGVPETDGRRLHAMTRIAELHAKLGARERSREVLGSLRRPALGQRDVYHQCHYLLWVGEAAGNAGFVDDSLSLIREAIPLARVMDEVYHRSTALRQAGELMARVGAREAAMEVLREAVAVAKTIKEPGIGSLELYFIASEQVKAAALDDALATAALIEFPNQRVAIQAEVTMARAWQEFSIHQRPSAGERIREVLRHVDGDTSPATKIELLLMVAPLQIAMDLDADARQVLTKVVGLSRSKLEYGERYEKFARAAVEYTKLRAFAEAGELFTEALRDAEGGQSRDQHLRFIAMRQVESAMVQEALRTQRMVRNLQTRVKTLTVIADQMPSR